MDTALLKIDAQLTLNKNLDYFPSPKPNLSLWVHNEACIGCPSIFAQPVANNGNNTGSVETNFPATLFIRDGDQDLCNLTKKFRENGLYCLRVDGEAGTGMAECTLYATDEGREPGLFILYAFLIYFALFALLFLFRHSKFKSAVRQAAYSVKGFILRRESMTLDLGVNGATNAGLLESPGYTVEIAAPTKQRLKSLDTFRGLSIVIMIFVNYKGGGYWYFRHSYWNGLTLADLPFPWFMFIMGTSMALSFKNLQRISRWGVFWKVVKRACWLFLLGLALNSGHNNDLSRLRIPGVLQRFSVTYLVVALMEIIFTGPSPDEVIVQTWWAPVRDIVDSWPQWLIMMAAVSLHTSLIFLMPVPNCPKGYLGPGGLHDDGQYYNCTGGATGYVDQVVFGINHMYGHPTCKQIYDNQVPFDPEGLLGCLTATLTVFLGLQAGKVIRTYGGKEQRMKRFAIWSLACGVIAAILCKCGKEGGWIPVNKNLWSLSYVLTTASFAYFMLLVLFWVVDIKQWWSGKPMFYAGMNAIALYLGHEILGDYFPLKWKTESNHEWTLFFSCWGTTFWTLVAYKMYSEKIFISL